MNESQPANPKASEGWAQWEVENAKLHVEKILDNEFNGTVTVLNIENCTHNFCFLKWLGYPDKDSSWIRQDDMLSRQC